MRVAGCWILLLALSGGCQRADRGAGRRPQSRDAGPAPSLVPARLDGMYALPAGRRGRVPAALVYVVGGVGQPRVGRLGEARFAPAPVTTEQLFAQVSLWSPAKASASAAPLLLIDGAREAEDAFELVQLLREHGSRLGIRAPDGSAQEHLIHLGLIDDVDAAHALPHLHLREDGYLIEAARMGGHEIIPRQGDRYLPAALPDSLRRWGPTGGEALVVYAEAGVTVADLVAALDAVADSGIERVVVLSPDGITQGLDGRLALDPGWRSAGHLVPPRSQARSQMTFGPTLVDDDSVKEMVRREVRKRRNLLQSCYETRLLKVPALQGTVTVDFEVDPRGRARGIKATGLGDAKVESCVKKSLTELSIPRALPDVPHAVRLSIVFRTPGL